MNTILNLIKNQIEIIEQMTGADITIHDNYNLFSNTELKNLPQLNRWHLNKYCLFVKENPQIFHKCVNLKYKFYDKVISSGCVITSTCFCGVAEYAAPILLGGFYLGVISVMGFKGDFSENKQKRLAKRLGISLAELNSLRNSLLHPIDNYETVKAQLEILTYLIKEFIAKETDILSLISEENIIGNSYVLNSLEYIDRNFTKDISVIDVANNCFISVAHLQNLFSKTVGHGVAQEIRNKRINYAKELLYTTEYSVKHIAFECGFESADYFSTVFKKKCGITPLKFRKKHRKSPNPI